MRLRRISSGRSQFSRWTNAAGKSAASHQTSLFTVAATTCSFFLRLRNGGENLRENLNFRQKCVFPHMEQLLRRYFSNGQRQSRGMPVTFDIVIARLAPTAERRRWTRTLQQAFPKEKAHDQSHDD